MALEKISDPDYLIQNEEVYVQGLLSLPVQGVNSSTVAIPESLLDVEWTLDKDLQCQDDRYASLSMFANELQTAKSVESMIRRGQNFVHLAYSYRSVSLAIPDPYLNPNVDPEDDPSTYAARKIEYGNKIVEVIRPEVVKLKNIQIFVNDALNLFQSTLKYMLVKEQSREYFPDAILESLRSLLDHIGTLQVVLKHKWKYYQVDLHRFRHAAASQLGSEVADEVTQMLQFYGGAVEDGVLGRVRKESKVLNGFDDVLLKALAQCLSTLEAQPEVFQLDPDQRFALHRQVLYLVFLLDGSPLRSAKLFKPKVLLRVLKTLKVLPIFADCILTTESLLKQCASYDAKTMASSAIENSPESLQEIYALTAQKMAGLREEAMGVLSRLELFRNRYDQFLAIKSDDPLTIEVAGEAVKLAKLVLSCTGRFHYHLQLFHVYALSQGNDYADVFRKRLSPDDLLIVADCLSLGKAVYKSFQSLQEMLVPCAMIYTQYRMQCILQCDLVPLLHRLDKRNKSCLQLFLSARALCVDVGLDHSSAGSSALEQRTFYLTRTRDYKEYSRKQGPIQPQRAHLPLRVTSASGREKILQLLLETALAQGVKWDLEKQDLAAMTTYLAELTVFPILRLAGPQARFLTDGSDFWLRETWFVRANEMLLGKHHERYSGEVKRIGGVKEIVGPEPVITQCAPDASLPFLLINHLVSLPASHPWAGCALGCVLQLLDLYNDAAHKALHVLNSQPLFDEVEAECTLLFDLLPLLLSEQLYATVKQVSCQHLLDTSLLAAAQEVQANAAPLPSGGGGGGGGMTSLPDPTMVSGTLFHQATSVLATPCAIPLLGRHLHLPTMLLPHLLSRLRGDIDLAIRRFEGQDVCHVVDLATALSLLQKCHSLLAEVFPLESFQSLLDAVNDNTSLCGHKNRIAMHFLQSLAYDLLVNYAYNPHTHRFVKGLVIMKPPPSSSSHASPSIKPAALHALFGNTTYFKAFETYLKLSRGFFGHGHWQAYLSLGPSTAQVEMMADQLVKHIFDKVNDVSNYYQVVLDVVPCQLTAQTGTTALRPEQVGGHANVVYGYWFEHLSSLLSYADIKCELFQGLREMGNTIALLRQLSEVQSGRLAMDLLASRLDASTSASPTSPPASTPSTAKKDAFVDVAPVEAIIQAYQRELLAHAAQWNNLRRLETMHSLPSALHRLQDLRSMAAAASPAHEASSSSHSAGGKGRGGEKEEEAREKSLFRYLLRQLEEHLYVQAFSTTWASVHSANHLCDALSPQTITQGSFAHFLSAILFLFCVCDYDDPVAHAEGGDDDMEPEPPLCNMAVFGRGVAIAGATLLHVLNQSALFTVVDICTAVLHHQAVQGVQERNLAYETFLRDASDVQMVMQSWGKSLQHVYLPRTSYIAKHTVCTVVPRPPKVWRGLTARSTPLPSTSTALAATGETKDETPGH